MTDLFVSQAAFARHRGVSRKTATSWKQRGLLVIRPSDGLIDRAASDRRLADHGLTGAGVTQAPKLLPGNKVTAGQGNKVTAEGNSPPPGFEVLDLMEDPFDAGALSMVLTLFYRAGPDVAGLAIAAGSSCQIAYSLERAFRHSVLLQFKDYAAQNGSKSLRQALDSEFIQMSAFSEVNWPNLAQLAGEAVDLDAWHAHHESKFSDTRGEATADDSSIGSMPISAFNGQR